MMKEVQTIIQIGQKVKCEVQEFMSLFPKWPIIHGSEIVFRRWDLIRYCSRSNLSSLIKGLHLVERKYCEQCSHNSGFGSPSQTMNLLLHLAESDLKLARELEYWISMNGGNYYIKQSVDADTFISKIQTREMRAAEHLITLAELERERKLKKDWQEQISNRKIQIHKEKSDADRIMQEQLLKMEIHEILDVIESDSRPIYFFKRIIEVKKEEIKNDPILKSKLLAIYNLKLNTENSETKKLRKLIE